MGRFLLASLPFVATLAVLLFAIYRNNWTYAQRTWVLWNRPHADYERLPSYYAVLWRFWVWDIYKFMAPPKGGA